jgi:hypothetical protein
MLLAVALAIPGIFWDGAADTAKALREVGVQSIFVPPARVGEWKGVAGITAESADITQSIKLQTPGVNYRFDQASASRAPWLDGNGSRFLRQPQGRFYYEVPGAKAALAAAEAFAWRVHAIVKTDADGLKPLAEMIAYCRGIESFDGQPVADFALVDDGGGIAGEVLNLLVRNNLLVQPVRAADAKFKLNVELGTSKYPIEQAKNPTTMAHMIRADLTDDRRSLRIYGTAVVVGRMERAPGKLRVHLINYDATRKVNGMRVRVVGEYSKHSGNLLDYSASGGATEFTLPELKTYSVTDLSK